MWSFIRTLLFTTHRTRLYENSHGAIGPLQSDLELWQWPRGHHFLAAPVNHGSRPKCVVGARRGRQVPSLWPKWPYQPRQTSTYRWHQCGIIDGGATRAYLSVPIARERAIFNYGEPPQSHAEGAWACDCPGADAVGQPGQRQSPNRYRGCFSATSARSPFR